MLTQQRVAVNLSSSSGSSTWEERYCAQHDCAPAQFARRIFWQTLHRHALPLAPLLILSGYFDADLELVASCARSRTMREVREEIEGHRYHPCNRSWLRRRLALRLSTRRLRRLAREYLPGSSLLPPISPSVE